MKNVPEKILPIKKKINKSTSQIMTRFLDETKSSLSVHFIPVWSSIEGGRKWEESFIYLLFEKYNTIIYLFSAESLFNMLNFLELHFFLR